MGGESKGPFGMKAKEDSPVGRGKEEGMARQGVPWKVMIDEG